MPHLPKLIAILLLAIPLAAQQRRVEPTQTHERLIAIVPLQGSGTMADPTRPMFAPAGTRTTAQAS